MSTLNPDGISIDFIRNFMFWEMIKPEQSADSIEHGCFCNTCVHDFSNEMNISFEDSLKNIEERASFIVKNYKDKWAEWKCQLIDSHVKKITSSLKSIKPDLKFNLHAAPWRLDDYEGGIKLIAGQDFSSLSKYVDYISPMCYSYMLYRDGEWTASVVKEQDRLANGKILPSIQVGHAYRNDKISNEQFETYLKNALKPPSKGVVFWSWEHLEKEPSKKKVIQEYLTFKD